MAQQLIADIGATGSGAFHASRRSRWPQYFPVMHRGAGAFPMIASQQNFSCNCIAPVAHGPGVARLPFRRRRTFSGAKHQCKKPTLQLSSYVVAARVFHMMARRFTQVFVASKALNHLQLSLTIARIC
ncbi:hypothetical protein [Burkholderia territorii]|uniref:hypothetical protein n=1 Tax=Burkholderia territorii TaxID=1503055 RepID=UPI000AC38582|nr:hypothetical protein [Burkholderia territorii]